MDDASAVHPVDLDAELQGRAGDPVSAIAPFRSVLGISTASTRSWSGRKAAPRHGMRRAGR
jgi:hypothetical protein